MSLEIRSIVGPESIDASDDGVIFGLAIPYNQETTIGDMRSGGFHEQIAPGSATKSLREADIVALFNHNSGQPLGRTSAGNLKLTNTARGVEPELKPVDTTYGQDLAKLVRSGVIKGWSFGFEVVKDDWTDDEGKPSNEYLGTNRTIREMKLIEVSPVTFPAYEQTQISSRDAVLAARESRSGGSKRDAATARNFMDDAAALLISAYNALSDEERASMPASIRELIERGGDAPGDGSKPYGNVTYADPGYQADKKKRYPLDTKAHVKAAWSYINKAKNAGAYASAQLAKVKASIKAACAKFGINVSEANEAELAMEWRCYLKGYNPEAVVEERTNNLAVLGCPTCDSPIFCKACDGASDAEDGDGSTADNSDHPTDNQGNEYKSGGNPSKETRKVPKGMKTGTAKRIPQIQANLNQACAMLAKCDPESLPKPVQDAIALVSGAKTHVGHIMDHEGMSPTDSLITDTDSKGSGRATRDNGQDFLECPVCKTNNAPDAAECVECGDPLNNGDDGRSTDNASAEERKNKPKPVKTTSADPLSDDALMLAYAEARSREIALDVSA